MDIDGGGGQYFIKIFVGWQRQRGGVQSVRATVADEAIFPHPNKHKKHIVCMIVDNNPHKVRLTTSLFSCYVDLESS